MAETGLTKTRISYRWRATGVILVVMSTAVFVRVEWVERHDVNADDLATFEAVSGIDLPDWYDDSPFFLNWTRGDGATFVGLASDLNTDDAALRIGDPAYRYSRVGYAWMGRVAALGRPALIPVGLFVVNVIALIVLAITCSRLYDVVGFRAYLLVANPAVYVAFLSDTAELVAVTALTLALYLPRRGAFGAAAILAITRPSLIPTLAARGRNVVMLLIVATASISVVALKAWFTFETFSAPANVLAPPLVGYAATIGNATPADSILLVALAIAALGTVIVGLTKAKGWVRVGWVVSGLLVLMLGQAVLQDMNDWARAAAALPVLWAFGPTHFRTQATRRAQRRFSFAFRLHTVDPGPDRIPNRKQLQAVYLGF